FPIKARTSETAAEGNAAGICLKCAGALRDLKARIAQPQVPAPQENLMPQDHLTRRIGGAPGKRFDSSEAQILCAKHPPNPEAKPCFCEMAAVLTRAEVSMLKILSEAKMAEGITGSKSEGCASEPAHGFSRLAFCAVPVGIVTLREVPT